MNVRKRQAYTNIIEDNAKYTALRVFQDIEGADVFYVNVYAAKTPRLPVFNAICSRSSKDGKEFEED